MTTILNPIEIPGLEQIETGYIDDAVAWAQKELDLGRPDRALLYRQDLTEIIENRLWRAPQAANILFKAQRQVLAHVLTSEHAEIVCSHLA